MATGIKKSSVRKSTKKPLRAVRLSSVRYSEFAHEPQEWIVDRVQLGPMNLIVGKNASGKSRFLSVISGLASMLCGKRPKIFQEGSYQFEFESGTGGSTYELSLRGGAVLAEKLVVNGEILLSRGKGGTGKIWAEKIGEKIDFNVSPGELAARLRRDRIQHPFLEDLHTWAALLRHFQFGSLLGKDRVMVVSDMAGAFGSAEEVNETNEVQKLYARAYEEFREEFDARILADLKTLGYDCTEVGAESVDSSVIEIGANPLVWLFVQERDLKSKTHQISMSQGMFRALAIVIYLNYALLRRIPRTLLIDDVGEGLDFSRAQAFIALLIEHALNNRLQLVMTTNDRFVMNGVPLEYWGVLRRKGSKVHLVNRINSPTIFEDFRTLGLNNFDFFATNFFEEGIK